MDLRPGQEGPLHMAFHVFTDALERMLQVRDARRKGECDLPGARRFLGLPGVSSPDCVFSPHFAEKRTCTQDNSGPEFKVVIIPTCPTCIPLYRGGAVMRKSGLR